MPDTCTFCGSEIWSHDPIVVEAAGTGEREGQFCNYACLKAHIEAAGLEVGASCEWVPPS